MIRVLAPSSWAALLLIFGAGRISSPGVVGVDDFWAARDEWDVAIGAALGALSRRQRGNKCGGCARYWRTETQDKGANDMHFLLICPETHILAVHGGTKSRSRSLRWMAN